MGDADIYIGLMSGTSIDSVDAVAACALAAERLLY